jgi:hypothetical protein
MVPKSPGKVFAKIKTSSFFELMIKQIKKSQIDNPSFIAKLESLNPIPFTDKIQWGQIQARIQDQDSLED